MAEFEEKLQAILGDPEAMGQIASLAQALSGGQAGDGAPAAQEGQAAETPPAGEGPAPDLSALLGALGGGENPLSGLDPQLLQAGLRLFAEYSAADGQKEALLAALRPFVKPERYARLDKAIQIARLARVIRVAFRLFQSRREEDGPDV